MVSTAACHVDIVQYIVDHGADDFNKTMKGSEFESNLDVIQIMISNGADKFHQQMESVASQGGIDAVWLLIYRSTHHLIGHTVRHSI